MKKILRHIKRITPLKYRVIIDWYRSKKYILNLNNPKTFGEKIQWIKVYGNLEKYTDYVDKYKVREYIKNTIGEEYLIELIDVYNDLNEIDFDKLPNQFVLKANFGAGYNIIVKDKSELNQDEVKNKINEWLKVDFYSQTNERQYKNINKKIICEKYMEDHDGELKDYKFFCFNGHIEIIQVDTGRFSNIKRDYYDTKWNKLNIKKGVENSNIILDRPKKLNEMINLAEKLSKNIPMVRVDFYYVDNNIYFGELTFTPANGGTNFEPKEIDEKMANLINLQNY